MATKEGKPLPGKRTGLAIDKLQAVSPAFWACKKKALQRMLPGDEWSRFISPLDGPAVTKQNRLIHSHYHISMQRFLDSMEHLSHSGLAPLCCSFAERFLLAEFEETGVLLDVRTGAFHHLNRSATRICSVLQRGRTTQEAAEVLGEVWRKDPGQLGEVIEGLVADLETSWPIELTNPIAFHANATGVMMCVRGQAVLHLDREGMTITAPGWPLASVEELGAALLLAVPHLLTLRGQLVLHASAVRFSRGVLAFCGKSGQGKTTTARFFAACGANLLAEDLLVVSLESDAPRIIQGAEPKLRQWAAAQATVLAQQGRIDTAELERVSAGPTLPLDEILFLRRLPQPTGQLSGSAVTRAEGMVRLLENSFAELGRPEVWVDIFHKSQRLTRTVAVSLLTVPEGLDLLAAGVADYSRTMT